MPNALLERKKRRQRLATQNVILIRLFLMGQLPVPRNSLQTKAVLPVSSRPSRALRKPAVDLKPPDALSR